MRIMIDTYLDNNLGDDLMIKILANEFKKDYFYLYTNSSTIKNTYGSIHNIEVRDTKVHKSDMR